LDAYDRTTSGERFLQVVLERGLEPSFVIATVGRAPARMDDVRGKCWRRVAKERARGRSDGFDHLFESSLTDTVLFCRVVEVKKPLDLGQPRQPLNLNAETPDTLFIR
jgi:hypothetical protein